MELYSALSSLLISLCLTLQSANAVTYTETLGMGQSIGTSDTLASANGSFELGFFPGENSTKYYAGIWFKKVPKENIVWVANREQAAIDSSAVLTIQADGNLVVKGGKMVYFVTNISNICSTYALLLDSGNLLLLNNSNKNILWQSFDDPTDTLLPGMNIGYDTESGNSWLLRSWTSTEDPSPGVFSLKVQSYKQRLIIMRESKIFWIRDDLSNFTFQSFNNRTSATWNGNYLTWQGEYTSRLVLKVSGELNQQYWSEDTIQWVSLQSSKCGLYGNAICGNEFKRN